jgi:hypothetical protein
MLRRTLPVLRLFLACLFGGATRAAVENTWDYSVQVSAAVQLTPPAITLSWPQDTNGTPSTYTVSRKAPGASTWGPAVSLPGSATTYTDTAVAAGTAYEYRVVKTAGGYSGYGYVEAGMAVPLVDQRGKVVLLVDDTMATPLATELLRLEQDLAGDGWTVLRHDVSRHATPAAIKAVIKADYDADRTNVKSVFLFGHVPVPYSGQLNPDGHPEHTGAWPADVYYGDMDGAWTDFSVNVTATGQDAADGIRLTNRPGDGKFDQTQIPSAVELEVGRVDLANMPGDDYWDVPAVIPSETELLRRYLVKDHNFRHAITTTARRALVGDYLGIFGGEAFAASGFRAFAPLVGAANIRNLARETNGQPGVWMPETSANDYLLVSGSAYASYGAIHSLGSGGEAKAAPIHEFISRDARGVITLLFGSWHGDWDHADNVLRAPLANRFGLASMWSGRPHWFLHPLGLGETLGAVARLTQNNTGLYQNEQNHNTNSVHIALMGDPTLRIYPVAPARDLNAIAVAGATVLSWASSSDPAVTGYHVYRGASARGPFTRLTSTPVGTTSFTDVNLLGDATYMVRAVKLESSPSGSYYNASQGVFWNAPPVTGKVTGAAREVGSDIHHVNGNVYDQVLLTGANATVTADPGQVTRVSFVDLTNDIVQVEFSGAGALTITLDNASGPAPAVNYLQPDVLYMKGHARIAIAGANESTNVSVFSVGRLNAVNQAIFRSDVTYDGFADIHSINIASANGRFGGVRAGNTTFLGTGELIGVVAPNVTFTGPLIVSDVNASADARPRLAVGAASEVRIAGGDLAQPNGRRFGVSGISTLHFAAGASSQGDILPPGQTSVSFDTLDGLAWPVLTDQ